MISITLDDIEACLENKESISFTDKELEYIYQIIKHTGYDAKEEGELNKSICSKIKQK